MKLAKFLDAAGHVRVALVEADRLQPLRPPSRGGPASLAALLHDPRGGEQATEFLDREAEPIGFASARLLAPIDSQEVWGAGVTYLRSKTAREEESETAGAAALYDAVYEAERPELFFKATPSRVAGPDAPIRARADSRWTVPEPELALFLAPDLRIVGFSIGNDVSARDIEGSNPLYLPQAKVYDSSCALGPVVALPSSVPDPRYLPISLVIERDGSPIFEGETTTARLARTFESLVGWLGRDNRFPDGVVLLTGTGVVPPDDLSLRAGDLVTITIPPIGTLSNPVIRG